MAKQTKNDSTDLLRTLDRKKQALEEVIHVAQTIERLQQGLQAVLLMGGSVHQIPRHVLQFYRGLDARLRGQPVSELSQLSNSLEQAIRNDLGQILQLAVVEDAVLLEQRDQSAQEQAASGADVRRLAEDFRRRVQSAVYLRVLLREQGVVTEPLELAVPKQQIEQQIEVLDERGRRCRVKAQQEVHVMLNDVQQCLGNATVPETLKEALRTVQLELQANLKHLRSGRPIEDMPFAIEYHLLQEDASPAAPLQREEAGTVREAQDVAAVSTGARPRPPGLLRCLWLWCVTPTSVSWSMLRSGRYRRSGKN